MMRDKVKGLVLGLSLGVRQTGGAAYASGTQIEIYFREHRNMHERKNQEVSWDDATGTVWVGKKAAAEMKLEEISGPAVFCVYFVWGLA